MASIRIDHPHSMGADAATQHLSRILPRVLSQYSLSMDRSGETFQFQRWGLSGSIVVEDQQLVVELDLMFPLSVAAPQIEAGIRRELSQQFH